jgi:glucose-1-phosphate thymidylyltransferase
MKGIILAGGSGTRLYPITIPTVKQLLPIYDKPMIYYPLSVLMLAGVREVLIISTPRDLSRYIELLGDGSQIGMSFSYAIQKEPKGLAEAFIIAESFIGNDSVWMILGDNIFFSDKLQALLQEVSKKDFGGTVFAYRVNDPERYGVIEFGANDKVVSIEEKPSQPKSNYAQTGLYYFDRRVSNFAKSLYPSARGELEIVDLAKLYLAEGTLNVKKMEAGFVWLDTGTFDSLDDASNFVRLVQNRQGVKVACIEEIAYRQGFITKDKLEELAIPMSKNAYGQYLLSIARE